MSLSTHVLDASAGRPAVGVSVTLQRRAGDDWEPVASGSTDSDGRIKGLGEPGAGVHRISFDTGGYFAAQNVPAFYPQVDVVFEITDPEEHYHVPLLLSPYAYSTYRGS
jgi:5-hydroxyisourate hydrolase